MPTLTPRAYMYETAARISAAAGVSLTAVLGRSRLRIFVAPRQEIMYTLRKQGFNSYAIGRFLDRDHKAVIHGYRKHALKIGDMSSWTDPQPKHQTPTSTVQRFSGHGTHPPSPC